VSFRLADSLARAVIEDVRLQKQSLQAFDRELGLMPNHAHVVLEMRGNVSLSAIVKSWKSSTARRANTVLGQSGSFWHADYFNRYMRDEDHLQRMIEYVEQNPMKAGLAQAPADWAWSSARFRP